MSIIYALIGRQDKIICQYTNFSGNFNLTAQQILKSCTADKKYTKYAANNYIFYILSMDQGSYLVMCDIKYSERIAFAFLQKVRKIFMATYTQDAIRSAKMYDMMTFSKTLKDTVELYNTPQQVDRVARLTKQAQEVSDIINQDLQKVINRGDNIKILVKKTQTMSSLSLELKNSSRTIRNQMMWQNWKWRILIALVIIFVVYIIMVIICGGFALGGCF